MFHEAKAKRKSYRIKEEASETKMTQHENKGGSPPFFANSTNLTERFRLFLKENIRFFYPALIAVSIKLLCSIFFYYFLNFSSTHPPWVSIWDKDLIGDPSVRWPFLYHGWDSGWYFGIVFRGYSTQAYAFFPGYPISIYVLNTVTTNVLASAALCSLILGVAWIPLFQAIAENYTTRETASRIALLAAFFPYVFLFTTVAYSESLFLFATVASWYSYQKDRIFKASSLAAVATITRMVGIIIVLPMFLDLFHRRERKRLLYTLIPPIALFAWLSYCFANTGDWLAPITAQNKYWAMYSLPKWLLNFASNQRMIMFASELSGVVLIILTSTLIYYGRKVDWRLTIYSVTSFLVILCFASMWSISRYLSFIFPIWITLGTRTLQGKWRNISTAALCAFFFCIAFFLWYEFLLGMWVA
ncbi:MAG: hypothetical protein JSV64_00750 [Candidatus Bathyarchaeota archaeon]|nr:MAG: hypothetical protein JSV64_00750 [Candidatus Bathyarchaeota archaeon]